MQYATAGIQAVQGDWRSGAAPTGTAACDDPERQFPVLRGGIAVRGG